jgi:hypothetical protein
MFPLTTRLYQIAISFGTCFICKLYRKGLCSVDGLSAMNRYVIIRQPFVGRRVCRRSPSTDPEMSESIS